MLISDLWSLYEADKRIQGFSTNTLRAYALQLKILVKELGDLDISEVTLNLLKEYLAKQSNRLKPSSLGHRIRFIRSLFRFAYEETYLSYNPSLKLREPKMDKRIPKFLVEEDTERKEFEYLFGTNLFPEIKNEYFNFWNILNRNSSTSDKYPLSAKYITKSKAARILGIHEKFIKLLIRQGIIREISQENLLNEHEVMKLRDQCTGILSENTEGRLSIRDLLYKHRYKGLNIADLMSLIVHGFLQPEKTINNTQSIMDSKINENELIVCLQLFQYKQPFKNKEVEAMRDNNVQLGMATITAKGLVYNGKVYSNPAMIKHQWFEHAEKFGDWKCPVGYFPENPEHIVMFDAQGLEVATSIENQQQHPDAAVLEAYYDAINSLKERLSQAKNQLRHE